MSERHALLDEEGNGSISLRPLQQRRRTDSRPTDSHAALDVDTSYHPGTPNTSTSTNMARGAVAAHVRARKRRSVESMAVVISSYIFDWFVILAVLGVAFYLNDRPPNQRPFSLENPDISFPFTEQETVPSYLLILLMAGVPFITILLVSLLFIPGATVPKGTPKSLVWRRKLWELHVGWLGLILSIASAWFITNGMKNLFGKPRPDLLARCNPDVANFAKYVVGGENVGGGYQRLVSAKICRGMGGRDDAQSILEDGFRSYPSGHASGAAAGLIYLSLFVASKFAITLPFLPSGLHGQGSSATASFSAFPSRIPRPRPPLAQADQADRDVPFRQQDIFLTTARQQAAAPPIYLLLFATAPLLTAVFIASSRWYDFRHHGFDILFGFLMGTACAFLSFRWYHLPISTGAGWAWGPRCKSKAWWAGVGSFSYAVDWEKWDKEEAEGDGRAAGARYDEEATVEGREHKNHSVASAGGTSGLESGDEGGRGGDGNHDGLSS